MFDKDVAPFQQKYVHLVEDIHGVYGTAKEVSRNMIALFAASLFSDLAFYSLPWYLCSSMQRASRC